MKTFRNIVFIFLLVLVGLFLHDIWITLGDTTSTELFFPKLHENRCFYLAFDRDIKDEKIIFFTCGSDAWGGSNTSSEIIMFCPKGCNLGEIFPWMNINQKSIAEIEKNSQQYEYFSYFKTILKKEYYHKHQKPLTEAVISYFYYSSGPEETQWEQEMLWYDHNSKILWYEGYKTY